MRVEELRRRATVHRTIHANRMLLTGTSEGAELGWETRRKGAGPAQKEGLLKRIGRAAKKVGSSVKKGAKAFLDSADAYHAKQREQERSFLEHANKATGQVWDAFDKK